MWEICPKIISSQGEEIGVDSEIGHNGANRKIYVQKQATAEEIQEVMMRKMDIKKQIYPKSREIRKQAVECMGEIGHNGASRSENVQK